MKAFRWGFVTLVFVYLYLPIALLVINSFNVSKYGHEWRGFSLKWYEKLAGNDALMQAFTNSLVIATLAATAATIIGTLMALAIYRYRFPLRKTASGLLFVVMLSPDIVLAITFLVIFIALGIQLGFWSLLIAHITFCLPFVVVTVYAQLNGFDKNLLEAAQDLGALVGVVGDLRILLVVEIVQQADGAPVLRIVAGASGRLDHGRPPPCRRGRQALHAAVLGFEHPITGARLRFESDLPADLDALCSALAHASGR